MEIGREKERHESLPKPEKIELPKREPAPEKPEKIELPKREPIPIER